MTRLSSGLVCFSERHDSQWGLDKESMCSLKKKYINNLIFWKKFKWKPQKIKLNKSLCLVKCTVMIIAYFICSAYYLFNTLLHILLFSFYRLKRNNHWLEKFCSRLRSEGWEEFLGTTPLFFLMWRRMKGIPARLVTFMLI